MAAREIAETQTADPRPDQFLHLVADFVKHPADLPIDSLTKNNADPRRLDRIHLFDPGSLTVEHYSAYQLWGERRIPGAIKCYLIFFFYFITRMTETLRQVAIVR